MPRPTKKSKPYIVVIRQGEKNAKRWIVAAPMSLLR